MSRTALELFKGSKLRTSIFALTVAIALLTTGIACVTPTTPAQPDEAVLIPDPPIADEPLVTVLPPNGGIPTPGVTRRRCSYWTANLSAQAMPVTGNRSSSVLPARSPAAVATPPTVDHMLVPACRTSLLALQSGSWGCPRTTIYISHYETREVTSLTTSIILCQPLAIAKSTPTICWI